MIFIYIILCTLSFFSKQDIGILQLLFIGAYLTLFTKKRFSNLFCFTLGLAITFFIIMLTYDRLGDFFSYFHLLRPEHSSRIKQFLSISSYSWILRTTQFYLMVFSIFLWFNKSFQNKREKIYILFSINFITAIVLITSEYKYATLIQQIPLSVYLIIKIFENELKLLNRTNKPIVYLVSFLLLLYLMPLCNVVLQAVKYLYYSKTYTRIEEGSYRGAVLPQINLLELSKIKSILDKHKTFLNLSEYTFLYVDYKIIPPKQLPLWFHYGVSFFEQDIIKLKKHILETKPSIILVQNMHGLGPLLQNDNVDFFLKLGYKTIFETTEALCPNQSYEHRIYYPRIYVLKAL